MKIYFGGSVRAGRDNKDTYAQIVELLKNYGEVLTEHIGDINLTESGEDLPIEEIYRRDMDWVEQSDVIVADISTPSIGVGYEIGRAEAWDKKIICLYKKGSPKKYSGMVEGNPNIPIIQYDTVEDIKAELEKYLQG